MFCVVLRRAVTSDINVQCVFNNAGFIVTGFYESSAEGKQMANLECNATAAAKVIARTFDMWLVLAFAGLRPQQPMANPSCVGVTISRGRTNMLVAKYDGML